MDRADPHPSASTTRETPTVVQGSVDGGTTEPAGVAEPAKVDTAKDDNDRPLEVNGRVVVPKDSFKLTGPPPDPPKKDDDRPDPDADGGGGGNPRRDNNRPDPEGSGGGGPRSRNDSRYRPADDDGGGGRGGGGGPRSYDAYPDPESSGGGSPRSRFEMPNPEDAVGSRGPGARIGNRTFGSWYGSGSGAL